MNQVWLVGAGIVFGWLMAETWRDPGCYLGLAIWLAVTALTVAACLFAVFGPRKDTPKEDDEHDPELRND
jgi:hypothetical protein